MGRFDDANDSATGRGHGLVFDSNRRRQARDKTYTKAIRPLTSGDAFVAEAVGTQDDSANGVVKGITLINQPHRVAVNVEQASGATFDRHDIELSPQRATRHDDGAPAGW